MNDYRTKSGSVKSLPTILCEYRELMTDLLKQLLPNILDEVDDVLMDIAVRTTNSQERTKYFNAMHEVRLQRHNIERRCLESFVELFSENLQSTNREMKKMAGADDVDKMTMVNIANKARNNCHQALLNLDERMSNVLKNNDIETKNNPLSPEVVCEAFYNACELIDSGTEIRLIIFKYFEKGILPLLNDVYSKVDHILDTGSSIKESQQTSTEENRSEDYQGISDTKQIVTSEIQNLLMDKHVPDFVSDFLLSQWVKLLVRIHDKNGMNRDSWRHAMETAEDLIWSVGNISSREDRDRFDKLWPDLVMRLRNGIHMISMSHHQGTGFISSLFKHRATLMMLVKLTKNKNDEVTLLNPEKIKALKMKTKSGTGQVLVSDKDLDSTESEDITVPILNTPADKRASLDEGLFDSDVEETDLDAAGSEDITMPGIRINTDKRPFMDELLVDNQDLEGFKSDITGG